MQFRGDFDALEQLVATLGYDGDWSDTTNGKQYRTADGAVLNWYPSTRKLHCQGRADVRGELEERLTAALAGQLATGKATGAKSRPARDKPPEADPGRVFVVHGHDNAAREQLELVLHKLGLDPFILANTGGGGMTIIEALEREIGPSAEHCRFGIVLLTPDDVGYARKDGSERGEPRARQNVVLEMGMLISALGRANVAILKKGHLEVPSDAQGILYLSFNDHVREVVPKLVDRLRSAGFELDASAITRASS